MMKKKRKRRKIVVKFSIIFKENKNDIKEI